MGQANNTSPGWYPDPFGSAETPPRRGVLLAAAALFAVLVISAGVVWLGSVRAEPSGTGTEGAEGTENAAYFDTPAVGSVAEHHGSLSFGAPGPGWRTADDRMLREQLPRAYGMVAITEPAYRPGQDWRARIVAGDLPASISTDGSLREVAERAAEWFVRTEWDTEPAVDSVGEATRVDGRPAWKLGTRVAYDIEGVRATHDDIEIMVIDYGPGEEHGLLIASVPNTDRQLWRDVERAIATTERAQR